MNTDISGMKILVAEDSRPVRLVLKTYIGQLGIDPDFAKTGSEAYEKLNSNKYDLLFIDLNMPGMNGIEIIEKMRNKGMQTPALAMTADDNSPMLSNCLKAGFNSFLLKPIRKDELVQIIMKRLGTIR